MTSVIAQDQRDQLDETARTDLPARRAAGLAAWERSRLVADDAAAAEQGSREGRLDTSRWQEVVAREAEAMRAHAPSGGGAPRVVVAHRQEWAGRRVADALAAAGLEVVACVADGADAVGVCVAEQPDLLVAEDVLQRMTGREVLREVRELSPGTACVIGIGGPSMHGPFLDAGARATHLRSAPVADVVALALSLLPARAAVTR